MDFRPNIAVVEIIKDVAFGRTYLGINSKWC